MGRRILVVDDSVVAAQQITGVLQAVGCEVVGHAKNGAEGLTLYSRLRPDLVMMDLVMPMMDGLQALRALRGLNAQVKVIVLSSLGGVESKATEALRMGAVAVVTKPIEAASVSQAVERALEGKV